LKIPALLHERGNPVKAVGSCMCSGRADRIL